MLSIQRAMYPNLYIMLNKLNVCGMMSINRFWFCLHQINFHQICSSHRIYYCTDVPIYLTNLCLMWMSASPVKLWVRIDLQGLMIVVVLDKWNKPLRLLGWFINLVDPRIWRRSLKLRNIQCQFSSTMFYRRKYFSAFFSYISWPVYIRY